MDKLEIREYHEADFDRLCQIHDQARKQELEAANLSGVNTNQERCQETKLLKLK